MYKFFRIASMPPVLVKPINGNTKANGSIVPLQVRQPQA